MTGEIRMTSSFALIADASAASKRSIADLHKALRAVVDDWATAHAGFGVTVTGFTETVSTSFRDSEKACHEFRVTVQRQVHKHKGELQA
jgi:hypothetical protein